MSLLRELQQVFHLILMETFKSELNRVKFSSSVTLVISHRKSDSDFAVPFILVNGPNPPFPERMPYATNELNSNSNAPAEDPGIFIKTAVNQ
jgi:hypothetical protein